jgi:prophage DNA circulation protein
LDNQEVIGLFATVQDLTKTAETTLAGLRREVAGLKASTDQTRGLTANIQRDAQAQVQLAVRQVLSEDLSALVKKSVDGSLQQLNQATVRAIRAAEELGKESRVLTLTWMTVFLLLGALIGALGRTTSSLKTCAASRNRSRPCSKPSRLLHPGDSILISDEAYLARRVAPWSTL